jgi:hypothetical protein
MSREPVFDYINGVRVTVTQPDDPAYALLQDPNVFSVPDESVYRSDCYICVDPEFSRMGLPLCGPCPQCKGHVPADDTVCTDCGFDSYEE